MSGPRLVSRGALLSRHPYGLRMADERTQEAVSRIAELRSRVDAWAVSSEDISAELEDILRLLNASDEPSRSNSLELISPEVIDQVVQVTQYVGTAIVGSWIARADNAAIQAILRRRKKGKRATSTQARTFARYQLNMSWDAGIRPSDEAVSEVIGTNGWQFSWVKDGVRFTASGDHNLEAVKVQKDLSAQSNPSP